MSIAIPLFEAEHIYLGPIDYEKDPEVQARWSNDAEFMRMMYAEPMRPLSAWHIKKKYEEIEKSMDEERTRFFFHVRLRSEERLIGLAELHSISWSNQIGSVRLGIGLPEDRRKGYGGEILSLLLQYAFRELNLYRLRAEVPAYNSGGLALFHKFGFVDEARRREAAYRDGRRWDVLHLGLLCDEWQRMQK
jgi:RimJ/RimL family protein N-acetyltransferase